jgi:hypothetical protein
MDISLLSVSKRKALIAAFSLTALVQVELRQFQIAGLRDLQINRRTVNHGDGKSGTLDHRGLIRSHKSIRRGVGHGFLKYAESKPLGRLSLDNKLARNRRCDDCTMRGALNLLDGVRCRQSHNGRPVRHNSIDGAVDRRRIDQRSHRIVYQDDVVRIGVNGIERMDDGLLAGISALDNMDATGKTVFCDLRLHPLRLCFADGNINRRDALNRRKSAQRMNQDRDAIK